MQVERESMGKFNSRGDPYKESGTEEIQSGTQEENETMYRWTRCRGSETEISKAGLQTEKVTSLAETQN